MRRCRYLISVAVGATVWMGVTGVAQASTVWVHPGQSIQAAINHAHAGDVIHLAAGDYHQNVTIQKSGVTLEGSGRGPSGSRILPSAHPVPSPCSGPGAVNGICIAGTGASVWGTVIRSLSVHGFSGTGVLSFHAAHTTVRNVLTVRNGSYGISGFDLTGVTYTNDVALYNGEPGFYVGDSPHANAIVTGNRAVANGIGDEGFGFFFRDSSWGKVSGNWASGNCIGFLFADTGENPDPAAHWAAWNNHATANNGACGGDVDASGVGMALFGAAYSVLTHNVATGNHATASSLVSGGIVVLSSAAAGGGDPSFNLVKDNTAFHNAPNDIFYDQSGTNNRFVDNHCGSSSPARICS